MDIGSLDFSFTKFWGKKDPIWGTIDFIWGTEKFLLPKKLQFNIV